MNKTQGTLWRRKGFTITWIQRIKKRSGEKEGIFHTEEDQGKFQSELEGKKGKTAVHELV